MNTSSKISDNITPVLLDPDGTGGDIFGVIVQRATGVAYGVQCEGVKVDERYIEGFFVPVSGLMFDPEDGRINVAMFRAVFHVDDACLHGADDFEPSRHIGALRHMVSRIPFWYIDAKGETQRVQLELDTSRVSEVVEAWVPVLTPQGPAVLVWPNCD